MEKSKNLSPQEVSAITGISVRTIQHWCKRDRLPVDCDELGRYEIPSDFVPLLQAKILPLKN